MLTFNPYLNNIHKGQRGFIIGGGPSVSSIHANLLQEEIVIGVNMAYTKFRLDYLVSIDTVFFHRVKEEITDIDCFKIIPRKYSRCFYDLQTIYVGGSEGKYNTPIDFETMSVDGSSGLFALRVSYLLGLNPIYLIGIDCTTSAGKSHFHEYYQFVLQEKTVNYLTTTFVKLLENMRDREIYSCSSISKLNGVIPYVSIDSIFL